MNITETMYIPPAEALDGITVYWHNYKLGQGMVTVVCWGSAWNCYFGGMGDITIQQFFGSCDVHYMTQKLTSTQWLKQSKAHERYVTRIVIAIREALAKADGKKEATK